MSTVFVAIVAFYLGAAAGALALSWEITHLRRKQERGR